jgi:hypothetical protein
LQIWKLRTLSAQITDSPAEEANIITGMNNVMQCRCKTDSLRKKLLYHSIQCSGVVGLKGHGFGSWKQPVAGMQGKVCLYHTPELRFFPRPKNMRNRNKIEMLTGFSNCTEKICWMVLVPQSHYLLNLCQEPKIVPKRIRIIVETFASFNLLKK